MLSERSINKVLPRAATYAVLVLLTACGGGEGALTVDASASPGAGAVSDTGSVPDTGANSDAGISSDTGSEAGIGTNPGTDTDTDTDTAPGGEDVDQTHPEISAVTPETEPVIESTTVFSASVIDEESNILSVNFHIQMPGSDEVTVITATSRRDGIWRATVDDLTAGTGRWWIVAVNDSQAAMGLDTAISEVIDFTVEGNGGPEQGTI